MKELEIYYLKALHAENDNITKSEMSFFFQHIKQK